MKTIVNYAQKVKEQHALNKTLAPVETDLADASRSYAIGEQFINDGNLFKAKTPIAQHDALVLDTNYEAADDITTQIKNKTVTTDPVPTENSTNPVQSNGVFVENRNIYEVMGKMGAKAILPMSLADIKAKNTTGTWNDNAYAINGVTFTVNTDSDGFITDIAATGTASADATLMVYGYSYTSSYAVTYDTPVIASIDFVGSDSTARGIVWGTNSSYIEATEVQIPAGTIYGFGLRVLNGYEIPVGGITFKPMIRFASDSDDTYQPYVKTNKELTAENEALTNKLNNEAATRSKLGAKNRLPITLASLKQIATAGTWANNVYTENGIHFTINTDASDYVTSVIASGTASGVATINLLGTGSEYAANDFAGMILTGCPSGGGNDNYRTVVFIGDNQDGTGHTTQYEDGAGVTIGTNTYLRIYLRVASGTDLTTPITFYPMIRVATDTDTTYQTYAKTNRELTAENQTLTNNLDDEIETRAKTGAHNWLPITLSRIKALNAAGTWNNNVYSINNLTITFNDDLSILVSGTPSENTELQLSDMFSLPAGVDFVMEGTPASGGANKYWWYLKNRTPSDTQVANINPTESGNVLHFTVDTTNHYYRAYLYIWASQAINETFYPLIRLASDPSTAYTPYAMTNKELTDLTTDLLTIGTITVNASDGLEQTAIPLTAPTGYTKCLGVVGMISGGSTSSVPSIYQYNVVNNTLTIKWLSTISNSASVEVKLLWTK